MGIAIDMYILIYGGFLIIAFVSWFIWDKRYHKNHGPEIAKIFELTDEVSIDPVNGKKVRVYYNPKSGDGFYHEE